MMATVEFHLMIQQQTTSFANFGQAGSWISTDKAASLLSCVSQQEKHLL